MKITHHRIFLATAIVCGICLTVPAWSVDLKKIRPQQTSPQKPTAQPVPSTQLPVPIAILPDLIIESIAMPVVPKEGEKIGQTARMTITVKNIGKKSATGCRLGITSEFVNVPQTPTPQELNGSVSVPPLGPGANAMITWPNFVSSATWLTGEYRFWFTVDPLSTVKEADEDHNRKSHRFNVVMNLVADLVATIKVSPPKPTDGNPVGPTMVTIKNQGRASAPASKAVFGCAGSPCITSACPQCTNFTEEIPLAPTGWAVSWSVPPLGAGQSLSFIFNPSSARTATHAPIPPVWREGRYTFVCTVDKDKSVPETGEGGEGNNITTQVVQVGQ